MDTGRKDANIQIGKRLREARLNMNLEKSEIADVLGVTVEHINGNLILKVQKTTQCTSFYARE